MSLLGRSLVLLALLACTIGVPLGYVAGYRRSARGLKWTRWMALSFAGFMALATLVMEYALLTHDFSVSYVAQVGSRSTPTVITIVSLWSALEGSILFWGFILGLFVAGLAVLQRKGHEDYLAYSLATALAVSMFFCFLIAGPGNPFATVPPPIPPDGPGPNPLLQNHILMIIHPPMLYLGYVGMTIPFSMAVAALLRGQLGPTWLRPMRNWLLVPWAFLTLGIMLGGWWAYEVLGWGGYWAWDPVENASFHPWISGTAAVHSAIVLQRRGTLKAWTIILIFITFLLTILGTFMTRSGVFNSVHSFTQSPIGPTFLIFLAVCSVAVLVLLALRMDTLNTEPSDESLMNREGAFLLNNLVLLVLLFTVLVGTLFPLIAEAVRGVKVSVGEPYFNRMAVPTFLALLLLMGVGPALPWGRPDKKAMQALLRPLGLATVALALGIAFGARSGPVLVVLFLSGYTVWTIAEQVSRAPRARRKKGEGWGRATGTSFRRAPRIFGAYASHLGVVVTTLAIAISSSYRIDVERTLGPGEEMLVGDYTLAFQEVRTEKKPHLTATKALVEVRKNGSVTGSLEPSLNHYPTRMQPIGTPAVKSNLSHDLYLTLMNVGEDGRVGLRAIVTPLVYWVWLGVLILVAGTALCLLPPRRATA
jgi:cytochrome c-type biogenesis protein CcmF